MIDKVEIKNIQSHKNSELEFVPGINVIIGSSNNGKSAILRALCWAVYNRPLGIEALCSHWNLDKKGNIINPMSVKVYKGKKILERKKTKNENQYLLNDEELNAVRTDVPKQASDFFKLSETNIQNQQDSPFLLSLSNGEVAKYFNRIANLDVIDNVLSNAESKRREIKKDIDNNGKLIEELLKKHEKYSWLKEAEKAVSAYEKALRTKEEIEQKLSEINFEIEKYNSYEDRVQSFKKVLKNKKTVARLKEFSISISEINSKVNDIKSSISEHKEILNKYLRISKFEKSKVLVDKIKACLNEGCEIKGKLADMNSDLSIYKENEMFAKLNFTNELKIISKLTNDSSKDLEIEFGNLNAGIEKYNSANTRIKDYGKELIFLKKKLPEVCPLCGSKMKNGVCTK